VNTSNKLNKMKLDFLNIGEQNIAIATSVAALSGLCNVIAVAVVVIANNRVITGQKGKEVDLSRCCQVFVVMTNIFFYLLHSIAGVVASLFGPVSIVVPVILSSHLVFNMIMFGPLLHTEKFPKEVRTGTFIVAISTILLPIVGPTVQHDQDIIKLLYQPSSLMLLALSGSLIGLAFPIMIYEGKRFARVKESFGYSGSEYSTVSFVTNVLTQSISQVIQTTSSKMFALVTGKDLGIAIAVFSISTITQSVAILQQGTTVKQSTFSPMNTLATIFLNAIFGIVIWEDWKVVQSWIGYSFMLIQVVLGNYLLSDFEFFEEIAEESVNAKLVSAETFRTGGKVPVEARTGMMRSMCMPSRRSMHTLHQLSMTPEDDI